MKTATLADVRYRAQRDKSQCQLKLDVTRVKASFESCVPVVFEYSSGFPRQIRVGDADLTGDSRHCYVRIRDLSRCHIISGSYFSDTNKRCLREQKRKAVFCRNDELMFTSREVVICGYHDNRRSHSLYQNTSRSNVQCKCQENSLEFKSVVGHAQVRDYIILPSIKPSRRETIIANIYLVNNLPITFDCNRN